MVQTKAPLNDELNDKLIKLESCIRELGSLIVGFSGGVDSTFLVSVAHAVLGDRMMAVTCTDVQMPEREILEAEQFCKERGIRHLKCSIDPLSIKEFRKNAPDRCYHCKYAIFSRFFNIAVENGIEHVAEGSNMDDLGDYRPGLRAVEELGIKSPLREAGLTKEDIRNISKAMGLPTWSKPSYACLASRLAYGEEITAEKLNMIDRAEQFLIEKGFINERVRMHGNLARIEVPEKDIQALASPGMRDAVCRYFKEIGFIYITLDLMGYRMGSMNASL